MRFARWCLTPAVLAVTAGTAFAGLPAASSLAFGPTGFETTVAAIVPAGSPADPNVSAETRLDYRSGWVAPHGTRNDAIRYRSRAYHRRSVYENPVQIHLGYFDPQDGPGNSFLLGLRGGPLVDPHIQLGASIDWMHRSEEQTTVAGDPYSQGGTIVTPTRVLSHASTDLLPMQLFLQLSGDQNMSAIPYGGIGGGYQVLFLSAEDYNTGASYDATFGGWGWQAWAGIGIPLSGQARLNGEFYVNQSQPERDVSDIYGFSYRERVDADGMGLRAGIQWGF